MWIKYVKQHPSPTLSVFLLLVYPLRKVAHIHVCLSLVDLQGGLGDPFCDQDF